MPQDKPKVTIDSDGTIHVDNSNRQTKPTSTSASPKPAKSPTASAAVKQNTANQITDSSEKPTEQGNGELSAPNAAKQREPFFRWLFGWIVGIIVGGILPILLIGGICAGIGLLVMNGLGFIPLIIFIVFLILSLLS